MYCCNLSFPSRSGKVIRSLSPGFNGAVSNSMKATTCQMSNVCCAMCSVVVKAPNDLLTRRPFLSGRMTSSYGHGVNGFLDKFIGHRTTDIRHLTSCGLRSFFSQLSPMTAGEWISGQNRRRFRRHPMMRRLLIRVGKFEQGGFAVGRTQKGDAHGKVVAGEARWDS